MEARQRGLINPRRTEISKVEGAAEELLREVVPFNLWNTGVDVGR